ncbi:fatty acid synthase [Rhipicephalus sanguineus]|uniref:fatty acid synthase n=1 Tax=Rhipicephalus sanguineus TaxID=34632 RepID=UPI001894E726|nr:fatty acid synthase [Rhipicephalus sanguineus]
MGEAATQISPDIKEDDIVISGLSGRFPQADDVVQFQEKLYASVDFVKNDEARWPRGFLGLPERMGTIRDLSRFDAQLFGVNPKLAHLMDPQIRLLLESSYEAIVDAGYDPATLRSRNVGVFIGCSGAESNEASSVNTDKIDGYGLAGTNRTMFSNRISHAFDFTGPSVTVDTACSSTLSALNHAVLAMRSGQCEAAIVGGSMLALKPATALGFMRLGMLSPDGKCKAFDAEADGYARSETVGAFFLQRARAARRIYCKVVHTKINADGYKSEGISFPSAILQEKLLREVYAESNVDPRHVHYIEAHGTGTKAGDPTELAALSKVFCGPKRSKALKIGSVKSNLGHNEAASGVSSLAKVILAMETGIIAGDLHFNQPNPNIPSLHDGSIEIVDKNTPLPDGPIGVNSFGFGGTNAHAILEPIPGPYANATARGKVELPRLVLLAGRTKESLERTTERIEEEGPYPDSAYALLNIVGQPSVTQFPYRGYMLVPVDDGNGKQVSKATTKPLSTKRSLWFVFTGVGCQWKGMAQQMMQFDVFARSIQRSHEVLKEVGVDLMELVTYKEDDGAVGPLYGCIAAVEVALVDVLFALGIRPDGMVGHSLGEIGCAYADGCLTAEQTVLSAYWRGRCVDTGNLPPGAMAAVGLTWEEATKRCPDGVQPACHNAENSVTVSGAADAVAKWVEELKAEGVFVREVNSAGVAFHSKYMESIRPAFVQAMQKIVPEPKTRSKRWLSTSLPPHRWQEALAEKFTPEYHLNNLVSPVFFFEALQHVPKDAILIEVAPHCLLQSVMRRSVGAEATCLGLMKRDVDNVSFFLNTLGQLHTLGVKFDPSPLYPPVPLPVPRGTPNIGHLVSWDHSQQWTVAKWNDFPMLAQLSEEEVEVDLEDLERDAYLAGHQLQGRIVFPAAGYILMVWKSLAKRLGKPFDELPVVLEHLTFQRVVILPKTGTVRYLVNIMRASGEFEISEGGVVVASGTIRPAEQNERIIDAVSLTSPTDTLTYELDAEDVYKELRLRGYEYHGLFMGILKAGIQKPYAKIKWDGNWVSFIDAMLQVTLLYSSKRVFKLPAKIQSCCIDPIVHGNVAEKAQESGIDALYDDHFNMIQAGGVAVKGLGTSTPTKRVIHPPPIVHEYQFVPYIDSERTKHERQAAIQEYIDVCSEMAGRVLRKLNKNEFSLCKFPQQNIQAQEEKLQMFLDNNLENHGLLKVLAVVEEQTEKSPFLSDGFMESLINTHKKKLESDMTMTALLEEDPLRHLLDVVVENTSLKSLQVLEIAAPGTHCILAPRVCSLSTVSNMLLKISYTIAQHPMDNLLPENVPKNAKIVKWDPTSDANEQLTEAHLVVACFSPWSSYSPDILANKLSKLCREQGFALIFHRTDVTPAERLISTVGKHEFAFYTSEGVERLLRAHGFQLVGQKSNNVSALLLLRKTALTVEAAKPILLAVNNAEYGWVDVLTAKALEVEQEPLGHNLWLIAEDSGTSGVVGLTNCLRLETGGKHIRCLFDASLNESEKIDFSPSNPIYNDIITKDLVMNIYRDGQWGSFRHTSPLKSGIPKIPTEFACLNIETTGDLSSLQWYVSPLSYVVPSTSTTKAICTVCYAPLNFRDVMLTTGKLSSDALPGHLATSEFLLGTEFSGLDRHGRRVMGVVPVQGLATAVAVDPTFLWEVPETWSLQQAATVPMVYATAYYALLVHGHMRPGESVLIHSGSGGVGQAAISIALSMGCTVFTTVGSENKREFLLRRYPHLKKRNIADSRNLSFEKHVLQETKGKGVDLVLNSLAEDKLQASVRCLATHGRFLEIGKVDLSNDSPLGMSVFLKGVTFQGVLFELLHGDDAIAVEQRLRVAEYIRAGIESGAVRPLDYTMFRRDQAEDAFRYMASGKHIGKIVLEIQPEDPLRERGTLAPTIVEATARTWFYEQKSYVITGGLGGFGLELAEWMVNRGCRKLLLTTRSGVRTGYQRLCLHRFQKAGANVIVRKIDASEEDGARKVIEEATAMGPVGGIFILAVLLRDGLLENQTAEAFETVFKIKIHGTRHLDKLSREMCPELDHFVAFSSLSAGMGNVGQTNYGYANSAMERICELRAAQGLPGMAIQWGAIADVGAFHNVMGDDATIAGTTPQRISSCIALMDQFLNQRHAVVSSCVKADLSTEDNSRKRGLVEVIARILGLKDPSRLSAAVSLGELGMDSLMAVEVRQAIERHVSLTLSMKEIRQLTIDELRILSEGTTASERA